MADWRMADLPLLRQLSQQHRIVVLTDPDRTGRMIREHFNEHIPGLHHAFISVPEGTQLGTNVGVENASPEAILRAMQQACESYGNDRKEFTKADMEDWGLAGSWSDAQVSVSTEACCQLEK